DGARPGARLESGADRRRGSRVPRRGRRRGPRGRGRRVIEPPRRLLQTARGELRLGGRVWLMGIVNATPDSFSDAGVAQSLEARVALAAEQLGAGADLIDIGGESGVTNRP